jgi:glycosyltransferase involved in cell wall biosynthesis
MLACRTHALVAVSEEVRMSLSRQLRLDQSAIKLIRNGVAERQPSPVRAAELRRRIRGTAGDVVLGTVGSLTPKKGHVFLLRALVQLLKRGVGCSLAVAGDGPERSSLESIAGHLGVSTRVHFLGEQRNVEDVLAAIDVFVLPSLVEGMPLALLEAMLAGKPVVATRVGGVPEAVTSDVNGILVEPGSGPALADAIERLARSSSLRDAYGARARETIAGGYTEAGYLSALAGLYRGLVGRGQP